MGSLPINKCFWCKQIQDLERDLRVFSRTVPLSMGSENWGSYLIANVLSHVRSVIYTSPWLNDFLSQAK